MPTEVIGDASEHFPVLPVATICAKHLSTQFVLAQVRGIGPRNNSFRCAKRLHGFPQVTAKPWRGEFRLQEGSEHRCFRNLPEEFQALHLCFQPWHEVVFAAARPALYEL